MAKTSTYWDKRALSRLNDAERNSDVYINRVKKIYNQAYKNIDNQIKNVYVNYSKDTGLDIQKLKELLTKKETDKTWKTLKRQGLDKYIKDNYKSRISRLEQIQAQIYAKAKQIYPKEELQNTMCYKGVINDSYYKAVYDTQMGTGYDFAFNTIDKNMTDALLKERWSGKNYSERIWGNTDILADSVSEIVGGALLSGQSIELTTKQLKDRFNTSKYYAERLVRTETNHFNNEADAMAYEEMSNNKYVFVATLDGRTSEICQSMDNKVFDYKDREEGTNFPPLHPNCRSKTRGYLGKEAEKNLQRRARNPLTGETQIIPNISYKEWYNKVMGVSGTGYTRVYGQKLDVMKKISYNKLKGKHDLVDDIKKTNPRYKNRSDPKYYKNCQRCVPAYEMRRRGYNVIAKPKPLNVLKDDLSLRPQLAWDNPVITRVTRNLQTNIEKDMLSWGDGARAQIVIYLKNSGGHTFIAEQVKGKTIFADPQTGETNVEKYFGLIKQRNNYYFRIDNLKPTKYIKDCCEEVKK